MEKTVQPGGLTPHTEITAAHVHESSDQDSGMKAERVPTCYNAVPYIQIYCAEMENTSKYVGPIRNTFTSI